MMKIGEFARKNKTTVRTLHHYEAMGLMHSRGRDIPYGDFIRRGDSALSQAKLDGRNCVREGE